MQPSPADSPVTSEVPVAPASPAPAAPVETDEPEPQAPEATDTATTDTTDTATVDSILTKLLEGDIFGAAEEIAQAVEDGNTEAVLEAVTLATQQGARENAGQALLQALRLGVSAPDLLPAFNIVNP